MDTIKLANKINSGFKFGGTVSFEEKEVNYISKLLNVLVKQYGVTKDDMRETNCQFRTLDGEVHTYKAWLLYELATHFNETVDKAKSSGQVEPLRAEELNAIANILELVGEGKGLGFDVVKPNIIKEESKKEEPKKEEPKIIGYSSWIKSNCEDTCVGYALIKKYGDRAESVANDYANECADGSDDYWTRPIYSDTELFIFDEYRMNR